MEEKTIELLRKARELITKIQQEKEELEKTIKLEKEYILEELLKIHSNKYNEMIDEVFSHIIKERMSEANAYMEKIRKNEDFQIKEIYFVDPRYIKIDNEYFANIATKQYNLDSNDEYYDYDRREYGLDIYRKTLEQALSLVRKNNYDKLTTDMLAALLIYCNYTQRVFIYYRKIYLLDPSKIKIFSQEYNMNFKYDYYYGQFSIEREELDNMIMNSKGKEFIKK